MSNAISSSPVRGVSPDSGRGQNGPPQTPPPQAAEPASPPPAPPEPEGADVRLVIEEDAVVGAVFYKTVDRRTGKIVSQRPLEQILRLREAADYVAGDVIKTKA